METMLSESEGSEWIYTKFVVIVIFGHELNVVSPLRVPVDTVTWEVWPESLYEH